MTAPLTRELSTQVPAVATVGNSDDTVVGTVPFDSTVTAVTYIPESTITGAATNNRTVSLVNKSVDGAGTTTVAALTFANGVNATGNDERSLTLSGTAANLAVAQGDVLQWRSVAVGTGIADPGGQIKVTVSRN